MTATPAVFAVEDTYQIMVKTEEKAVMWVKIGERCFYDHSNGILRSETDIHRMTVPAALLDATGSYTVCKKTMPERKPYFTEAGATEEATFIFKPVRGNDIRAYHIADTHNKMDEAVRAAEAYGKIDFLIVNGDIPDHSGEDASFEHLFDLCGRITHGQIPIVYVRGNHDMRGAAAERLEFYTPTRHGKSYYTVRLGGFWGLILDCGEDKPDSSTEYGNTICCHEFRLEETDFIKQVIHEKQYAADGIVCRAVIAHNPFTQRLEPPFDIEEEIYQTWTQLLNEDIKPHIMICGHMHTIAVSLPGSETDHRGQTFPVVTASATNYDDYFAGVGFELCQNGDIHMTVTDSFGHAEKLGLQ